MKPANILHLHSSFDLGGKERRAVDLMNIFGDAAHHWVLSAVPDAMGARDAIARGITAHFPKNAPPLHGRPGPLRYRQLADYMRRFDLVLSYNWGAMDGVMAHTLLQRVMRLPHLIHHEDGFNADEVDRRLAKRNLFRTLALTGAYALAVPSQTLETIATTEWRQTPDRIMRIPNGIDTAPFEKKPQRGALPGLVQREGEIVVGSVAGLRAVKNLPRLVRAVAAAGPHIRLVIVGDGPERGAIAAEAARVGMADRLLLPGFKDSPHRYVGLFDIFALSSDSEQFPISMIEAMAAGLPVVAPTVGDIAHIPSRVNAPYLTPPGDEAALGAAIAALAADSTMRSFVGEANRSRAAGEYGLGRMRARYANLYAAAMGRPDWGK